MECVRKPKNQMDLVRLHKLIDKHFGKEDLKTLCFYLGVDYDTLPADGKSAKARELVQKCEREDELDKLLQECQGLRPKADWPSVFLGEDGQSTQGVNPNFDTVTGMLLEIRNNMEDLEQLRASLDKIEEQRLESIIRLSGTQQRVLKAIPETPTLVADMIDLVGEEISSLKGVRKKEMLLRFHELRYLGLIDRRRNVDGKWVYWRKEP